MTTKELKIPEMSLRDYFAAKAMQGLLANGWNLEKLDWVPDIGSIELARDAYMIADAMLKARTK